MIYVSLAICGAFLTMILIQIVPTRRFLRRVLHPPMELLPDDAYPPAVIVLCLRGWDFGLRECLEALVDQDYPDFALHIVVDNQADPAWQECQALASRHVDKYIHISALETKYETCSLKCSSQVQAIMNLDETVGVVAFVDADVTPHRSWLRELTAKVVRGEADIAIGQRWYMPDKFTLATIVRAVWNARGVIHAAEKTAWGGSFALTVKFIHESSIVESWKKSFSDDGAMCGCADEHELRVGFVPSVLMLNRDEIYDLRSVWRFMMRQLVIGRLYTQHWLLVSALNLLTTITFVATSAVILVGLAMQHWPAVALAAGGALAYFLALLVQFFIAENAIRTIAQARGERCVRLTVRLKLFIFLALPVYQLVDMLSIARASFVKRIDWRGVEYQLDGPWKIRMLGYRPYVSSAQHIESTAST